MGMLFRRNLVTFGPRELLLTSDEPVVRQFLSGRRSGPIGMSEEKDEATLAKEQLAAEGELPLPPRRVAPQLEPSAGLPPRQGGAAPQGPGAGHVGPPAGAGPRRGPGGLRPGDRGAGMTAPPVRAPAARRQIPGTGALRQTGQLMSLAATTVRDTFRRPFQARELIEQFWFVASVTILPAALVSIPFGAVIALQVGSLTQQFGAQSFTGGGERARRHPAGQPADRGAAHRRRGRHARSAPTSARARSARSWTRWR